MQGVKSQRQPLKMYICVYVWLNPCTLMHAAVHMCLHIYMCICVYMGVYVCMCTYMCVCVYTCACVSLVCMCICVYVYAHQALCSLFLLKKGFLSVLILEVSKTSTR